MQLAENLADRFRFVVRRPCRLFLRRRQRAAGSMQHQQTAGSRQGNHDKKQREHARALLTKEGYGDRAQGLLCRFAAEGWRTVKTPLRSHKSRYWAQVGKHRQIHFLPARRSCRGRGSHLFLPSSCPAGAKPVLVNGKLEWELKTLLDCKGTHRPSSAVDLLKNSHGYGKLDALYCASTSNENRSSVGSHSAVLRV